MPTHQTSSHKPARWRAKAALAAAAATAALGLAAIPAAASAAPPSATITGGPTAYEQQLRNLNLPIGTGNVHTIALTTPLPAGHYLVNAALDIANIPPAQSCSAGSEFHRTSQATPSLTTTARSTTRAAHPSAATV